MSAKATLLPPTPAPAPRLPAGIELDDARLIDRLQLELPLTERPFADTGAALGLSEATVIDRLIWRPMLLPLGFIDQSRKR